MNEAQALACSSFEKEQQSGAEQSWEHWRVVAIGGRFWFVLEVWQTMVGVGWRTTAGPTVTCEVSGFEACPATHIAQHPHGVYVLSQITSVEETQILMTLGALTLACQDRVSRSGLHCA